MYPGLSGGFFFDDTPNIVENRHIQIQELSFKTLQSSLNSPTAGPLGRPVSVLSFAITHAFFGLDAFAYKAVNLFLHLINGVLVAWLIAHLLSRLHREWSPQTVYGFSLWVAAIWLVNPINVLPIMLSVQRMTVLSTLLLLCALIFHLKALALHKNRRGFWFFLALSWLILWPLAIFSKETGLLFPLFVLVISWLSPSRDAAGGKPTWMMLASICALLGIGLYMFWHLGLHFLDQAYAARPFTLGERLMTEARVLWFYVAQILTPNLGAFGIYLDDFPLSHGLLQPISTLAAIIAWAVVLVGIYFFRIRAPFLALCAAWFLVGHSLESSIVPLEIAHEHRNYLPSMGLLAGAAYLGLGLLRLPQVKQYARLITWAALLPILLFAFLTWLRTSQMAHPLQTPHIEAARHPLSARAQYTAALSLIQSGQGQREDELQGSRIREYLKKSVAVDPNFKLGYHGLILWSCASERALEPLWLKEYARRLQHTAMGPKDEELPHYLIVFFTSFPNCLAHDDAVRLFQAGADNPRISKSLRARFLDSAADYEFLIAKDPAAARKYLTLALDTLPGDAAIRRKLTVLSDFPAPASAHP